MNNKLVLTMLLVGLLLAGSASAYIRLCLFYGEAIPNSTQPIYKCKYDSCLMCVTDQLFPTNPNFCNNIASCSHLADVSHPSNTTLPAMIVSSPMDNYIYNKSGVIFNLSAGSSKMKFTFKNNLKPEYGWQTICTSCSSVVMPKTFSDGYNSVIIMGTDGAGRSQTQSIQFRVDALRPTIGSTFPAYGASTPGKFGVKYTELNLKNVTLMYKPNGSTIYTNYILTGCGSGVNAWCNTTLGRLPQGKLYFRFFVTDIFRTTASAETYGIIDTIATVLNVSSPKSGTYSTTSIKFNLSVSEVAKVSYMDYSLANPTWSTLCTGCNKLVLTKSLTKGTHRIQIKAEDKALNYDLKEVIVNVV